MRQFEYDITTHPAHEFTQVVYFCSEQGECRYDELPSEQIARLGNILNEKGSQGWELVQLSFGKGGVVAFWKRDA
jgi:hypothetical protein